MSCIVAVRPFWPGLQHCTDRSIHIVFLHSNDPSGTRQSAGPGATAPSGPGGSRQPKEWFVHILFLNGCQEVSAPHAPDSSCRPGPKARHERSRRGRAPWPRSPNRRFVRGDAGRGLSGSARSGMKRRPASPPRRFDRSGEAAWWRNLSRAALPPRLCAGTTTPLRPTRGSSRNAGKGQRPSN